MSKSHRDGKHGGKNKPHWHQEDFSLDMFGDVDFCDINSPRPWKNKGKVRNKKRDKREYLRKYGDE